MSIAIVSTGGTIASVEKDGGGATPELDADDIVAAVPELGRLGNVQTHEFSSFPSPHFTVEQMYDLTTLIQELDSNKDIQGIVVTQGTDVLEEVAYFLDLCYDGETPVALTGAMRNPSLPSPDGPINLLASAQVVLANRASEIGVMVVFNDRVYSPPEVTKTNTMNVDTFRSPEFGPLAVVEEDSVTWRRSPTTPDVTYTPTKSALSNDVHAVTATADMPPAQIEVASNADALCLATLGAGHIPPKIIPSIKALRSNDVPIIATSRCSEGRLARGTYRFKGSEYTLQELGCYYSDRPLQKARIETIVAMAADHLDDAFDRPSA